MRPLFSLCSLVFLATISTANAACDFDLKQQVQLKLFAGLPLNAASTSMYPTFSLGSVFFAKSPEATGPKLVNGDIIAFCLKKNPGTIYIKRLIGLPGDKVAITDNEIVLNGTKLPRTPDGTGTLDYARDFPCFKEQMSGTSYRVCQVGPAPSPLGTMPEVIVPAGQLFVLGDNRDNSLDSRMPRDLGPVLIENLIGIVKPQE